MKHITQLKPSIAKIASEMSKTYSDALNHINGNVTFRALPDSDIKEYLNLAAYKYNETDLDIYVDNLLKGHRDLALSLVLNKVKSGVPVKDIYTQIFQPVQYEIGRLWQTNKISVAQEHYATAVSQLVMSQLYPHIFSTQRTGYRMVAACVGNELHEIGIRMVSDFFEIAGWDTYYLGANTPAESIIQSINQKQADVVALSVTMSSQILKTQSLIADIRQGSDPRVKVLVGGHPFNVEPMAWRRVGADGYAANAEQAIEMAFALLPAT